jgi:hypothetical protein
LTPSGGKSVKLNKKEEKTEYLQTVIDLFDLDFCNVNIRFENLIRVRLKILQIPAVTLHN